jgi:hypothetical protein
MWNKVVQRGSWRSFALFLSLSGCTALSDCKYELGQKVRTGQAWHEFDGCNEQCFTVDYRDGWKKGYYDVLTGGDGRPPVVPPKKYWKPPVFTEHDPSRQDDWYTGYQDGAACAKAQPDFHYVPTFMAPSMHPAHYGHEVVEVMPTSEHSVAPSGLQPMPDAPGGDTAPAQTIEAAPGTDPTATAPKDSVKTPEAAPAAPEPKAEDYEKDPEPKSTSLQTDPSSATQRLVSGYRHQSGSYLDQLVRNAAHSTDDGSTISE